MTTDFNDTLDAKGLMEFYKGRGFCISYRQLREWQRTGIVQPQKVGTRKNMFTPTEVEWAGAAFVLRTAGKNLDFIKKVRMAVTPKKSSEKIQSKRTEEYAILASLLSQQSKTTYALQKMLCPDVIAKTDKETVLMEFKSPTASKAKRKQMTHQTTYYKNFLESQLKDKKVKCEVKTVREKRGLSQVALSKIVGFSQAQLSQIENGWIAPNPTDKNRIAEALNEKVTVLFPKKDTA